MPWARNGYGKTAKWQHIYGQNTCYNCRAIMEAVGPPSQSHTLSDCDQYSDALEVNFIGGYGMMLDPTSTDEERPHVVICQDCAMKLVAAVPWIKRLLNDYCYAE